MSAAASPSEDPARAAARTLDKIRVDGGITATFSSRLDGPTGIATLAERGGYRLKFPRTHSRHADAVIINTGGGVVGGDRIKLDFSVQHGADATVTTQAAERIYRTIGSYSEIDARLDVCDGARLIWAPQETILFSGARLRRRCEVDVAPTARFLFAESMIFGRTASGEVMDRGALHDSWRVRRDGRLIFAEANRLDDVSEDVLHRLAILGPARAFACILYVAPDAEARLASVREVLESAGVGAGASAWNGLLVVRFVTDAARDMRHAMVRVMQELSGASMPRVWSS
ncbi:MAG: urease accessory protein UreD [Hyphomicrobiaceae bacterium]